MTRVKSALPGAVAVAVGAGVCGWWCKRRSSRVTGSRDGRWLTVTVHRAPEEVRASALPEPLKRCEDRLEIRLSPAPGNRGTELAVRPREPVSALASSLPGRLAGRDPRQEVRTVLREAKAVLEAGEVLRPDPPTTHDTFGGKVIGLLTRRSRGEGVL